MDVAFRLGNQEDNKTRIFLDNPEHILQFENLTKDKVGKVYYKTREGYVLDLVVNPMSFVIIDNILKTRPHWLHNTIILENVLVSAISAHQECTGQIHVEVLYEGDPEHDAFKKSQDKSQEKKDIDDVVLAVARMAYREIIDVIEKWENMGDGTKICCHWDECITIDGELFQRRELRGGD